MNRLYYKVQVKMRVIILLLSLCASFANSRYLLVNLKKSGKDASRNILFSDRVEAGKILNILANTFQKVIYLI